MPVLGGCTIKARELAKVLVVLGRVAVGQGRDEKDLDGKLSRMVFSKDEVPHHVPLDNQDGRTPRPLAGPVWGYGRGGSRESMCQPVPPYCNCYQVGVKDVF